MEICLSENVDLIIKLFPSKDLAELVKIYT